jgi:hypothetical protein
MKQFTPTLSFSWVALVLVVFGGIVQAQIKANDLVTKRRTVLRISAPVAVDGLLTDSDWDRATAIEDILQREPVQGSPATERTEFRLLFDAENLYIGVKCFDSNPSAIVSTQMSRDADLSVDDRIEILIDTFRDRRNAFYFSTNPSGALVDGLIVENGNLNREWASRRLFSEVTRKSIGVREVF